ncbi:hypothetical protein SLEP1_g11887 [Rubroshorea leprosula]|nr:hypothetical protein SLEP1_g11887 [Rubroshorea leprosula]
MQPNYAITISALHSQCYCLLLHDNNNVSRAHRNTSSPLPPPPPPPFNGMVWLIRPFVFTYLK